MSDGVAIYVFEGFRRRKRKRDSYEIRKYRGVEMIRHAITTAGTEVGYCGVADAHTKKVVLVSLTAPSDWLDFIKERARWKASPDTKVVVGGVGMVNVAPFLQWFDVAVFGRGEDIVAPLVTALLQGERYEHRSVCYPDEFSLDRRWYVNQSTCLYPHAIDVHGEEYTEHQLGCQRRCLFCMYTWHRKNPEKRDRSYRSFVIYEKTIRDLLDDSGDWGIVQSVGLDGVSERLRNMVGKKITRDMFRDFGLKWCKTATPKSRLSMYQIVGFPTETRDEWQEFLEDIRWIAERTKHEGQKAFKIHVTPFRAMPATPAAVWPMKIENSRGALSRELKSFHNPGNVLFQSPRLWAYEDDFTETLGTTVTDMMAIRGTVDDSRTAELIATSKKFWNLSAAARLKTLEKYLDIDALFAEYTWDNYPVRYLRTYAKVENMKKPWESS